MDPVTPGIVSNLVAKIVEVGVTEAIKQVKSLRGARDELKKLEQTFDIIQAQVRDAEGYQGQERQEFVAKWLLKMKHVVYQADDLFDKVLTLDRLDQRRRTARRSRGGRWPSKVQISAFVKSTPLYRNKKLVNEIKSIRQQLDDLKSDMDNSPLPNLLLPPQQFITQTVITQRETGSHVKRESVIGRANDAQKIIDMLIDPVNDEKQITVIPIVGFGGLGKTTLAQFVFTDPRVKDRFKPTAWVYVPEKNDVNAIKRRIFKAFPGNNSQDPTVDNLEDGIINSIANKKYLLVLDDLWTEEKDDIKKVLELLEHGKKGSKIIVTTRLDVVTNHRDAIGTVHRIKPLTDDKSWELFENLAFELGQESSNSGLSDIGRDIITMCGNVPLAIEVVAAFLSSHNTPSHWLKVKDHLSKAQWLHVNDNLSKADNKVMAVLQLSYDFLPPECKLCFAYCSLFPKGYKFKENDMVHLWLAQGYIELDHGERCFSDLVARNLFQGYKVSDEGGFETYKMHDLLHDLAQKVAGDDTRMYERGDKIHDRLVHVNLEGLESPPSLKNAKRLRSLFNFDSNNATNDKFFLEFQSIRVLSMSYFKNENLLDPIGGLIQLRYLKLKSKIEYLPDSITRLINLQTLNLEECRELKELPRDFAKLVDLRHLVLPRALIDLPPGFGNLTCLQELNRFIVGENNGIDSLGDWNVRGKMRIEFKRWRRDASEEVKRANLKGYNQLTSLELDLHFMGKESTPYAAGKMNKMLKCLQFPPELKYLEVWDNHIGDEMPVRWLDGLSQLVSIKLTGCWKCKVVPDMSWMPHLKSLELDGLWELEYVEDEHNNISSRVGTAIATHNRCFFPSLQFLKLSNCDKLKGWRRASSKDDGEGCQLVFSPLLKMEVWDCRMLMSMPLAPKMETLNVGFINWKMFEDNGRSNDDQEAASSSSSAPPSLLSQFTSLKELHIYYVDEGLISLSISSSLCNLSILDISDCSELRNLRFESPTSIREIRIDCCSSLTNISEGLQHLCRLQTLVIIDCEELELEDEEGGGEEGKKSCSGWQGLSSLRQLKLARLAKVKTLPRGIACLTTLQELHIQELENLTELRGEIGNVNFPLLQILDIRDCPKMKSFPTSIQHFASLQSLAIGNCPHLEKMIMPNGENWHLLQHVPDISIYGDVSIRYSRRDFEEM